MLNHFWVLSLQIQHNKAIGAKNTWYLYFFFVIIREISIKHDNFQLVRGFVLQTDMPSI